MPEPIFNGYVVATNLDGAAPKPKGQGLELPDDGAIHHPSGAYIRFSPEGDIFLVPAPGRTVTVGRDKTD